MGTDPLQTIILLSGGIDSATLLAQYVAEPDAKRRMRGLFIDYGQKTYPRERVAARAIAKYYKIPLEESQIVSRFAQRGGEFFGRNALLALLAATRIGWEPGVIALGIHTGDYYDTGSHFLSKVQAVLDGYTAGTLAIVAPFLKKSKADIVALAVARDVPLHLTYSCERWNSRPCNCCDSCHARRAAGVF